MDLEPRALALERWLQDEKHTLLLQRAGVQLPAVRNIF